MRSIATTTASYNTANGYLALYGNTTGSANTATGLGALSTNTTGTNNTATGALTFAANTTGSYNTANGEETLFYNTTGLWNTANGYRVLFNNTTGNFNTANGYEALYGNTTGADNTAIGYQVLYYNTTGNFNTANGHVALGSNTTGFNNTANGYTALILNRTGSSYTAVGYNSLGHNTTNGSNIALGESAGTNLTTGSNNIDIGSKGLAGESNTIRIGKRGTQTATIIAGIRDTTVTGGVAVMIDANGRLGTVASSARFKDAVKPMDNASEVILALRPVTFRYKKELDPDGIPQFGLVAEQVEKVNPDLVARDADGKIYTVRYDAVNAMLLNEFIKEHRTVQELKKEIAALTATVQKVSAQVEISCPAPQTVVDNH